MLAVQCLCWMSPWSFCRSVRNTQTFGITRWPCPNGSEIASDPPEWPEINRLFCKLSTFFVYRLVIQNNRCWRRTVQVSSTKRNQRNIDSVHLLEVQKGCVASMNVWVLCVQFGIILNKFRPNKSLLWRSSPRRLLMQTQPVSLLDDVVQGKRIFFFTRKVSPHLLLRQKYMVSISSVRNLRLLIESKRCKYVHRSEGDNDGSRH